MSGTNLVFVGTGAIGLPMAVQLMKTGHPVIGVDPVPAARDRASAAQRLGDQGGELGVATMTTTTRVAGASVNRPTIRTPAADARSRAAGTGSTPITGWPVFIS